MSQASELDALIVGHIADLEAARRRLDDILDPRLLDQTSAILRRYADAADWVHVDESDATSIAPKDWVSLKPNGEVDRWICWIEFESVETGGDLETTFQLTDFLGLEGTSSQKALSFNQNLLNKTKWRAVMAAAGADLQALRALGFDVDERWGTIFLPVRINADLLIEGLRSDDLTEAFAPIERAVEILEQAMPHFRRLAEGVKGQ